MLPNYCALCGWAEDVDACHILPVRQGGTEELDNFVMLCPNHHRMFDRGAISREQIEIARHTATIPSSTSDQ
jgi:predicted restriction endonuclease